MTPGLGLVLSLLGAAAAPELPLVTAHVPTSPRHLIHPSERPRVLGGRSQVFFLALSAAPGPSAWHTGLRPRPPHVFVEWRKKKQAVLPFLSQ